MQRDRAKEILPETHPILVNSAKTISVSNDAHICQEIEKENKCYKNFGDHDTFNIACLNLTSTNSSAMIPYCGINSPDNVTPYESKICPQIAISKIIYHQCYNTIDLSTNG